MPPSILERYERILQADPKSRVFVELARALLERGEPERAAALCERGVVHHPDSVLARVLWGRACLATGRRDEAILRFEEAVGADPSNAYAYDLVGEALVQSGLGERATAILEAGAKLHPGDARIQLWLKQAREMAVDAGPGDGPASSPAETVRLVERDEAPSVPPPLPSPQARAPRTAPDIEDGRTSVLALLPDVPGARETAPRNEVGEAGAAADANADSTSGVATDQRSEPAPGAAARADGGTANAATTSEGPGAVAGESHAAEVARHYEDELREQLLATVPAPRRFVRRHLALLAAGVAVIVAVAAIATYAIVRARHRDADVRSATEAASKGIARDTLGSLQEASHVLAHARRTAPADGAGAMLAAQVAGLLAYDFDDARARASARDLVSSGAAGSAAPLVTWLASEAPPERDDAARSLLRDAQGASPLADAIAGEILLARGEVDAARARFERAAAASPPSLRAVSDLGDVALAAGDPAAALDRYRLVLRLQPRHPRAALGAAEATLQLGRDRDDALQTLEAVEADPRTAVPVRERNRLDVIMSRLLAATGRLADAERRITAAVDRAPQDAAIAAAHADVLTRSGDVARALAEAERARDLAPGDARYRELVAALQLKLGRFRELLATTESHPTRTLHVSRGIARLTLGDAEGARKELEATRRDGKMTAEAAAWMALAELASGHPSQAGTIVDMLLASPTPQPVALLARGRLDLAAGHADPAEQRFRAALELDPDLTEARCDLGRLLLDHGRAAEARELLEKGVARAPWRAMSRVALARARLATGDRDGALQELNAVLSERPGDPIAVAEARRTLRLASRR